LGAVVGVLGAGAGILHLLAARDHTHHWYVATFFVLLALAQFAWGGLAAFTRSRRVLTMGIAGNLAVVAVWAFSRTTGIPLFDATRAVEPIGIADGVAVLFELTASAGAALALTLPSTALRTLVAPARIQRLVAGTAACALLLTVPAFLTESHGHGTDDHGHASTNVLAAAAHPHDATELVAGDGHDAHAPGTSLGAGAKTTPIHEHADLPADVASATGHPHAPSVAKTAAGHAHDDSHMHGGAEHADHADGSNARAASAEPAAVQPAMPRPRGKVAEVMYGPFVLPSVDLGGEAHYNRILPAIPAPCVNCMVTAMIPDLVYVDGTSANMNNGPMLHHMVAFDALAEDPTCGRGGVGFAGHRIFAAGNERTPMLMPDGYAIPLRSPWWVGVFELMNSSLQTQVVWFKLTVRYLPMDDPSVKPVVPVWLDVDNCGDSEFAVPKGRSVTSWKWKSNMTGRIVAAGGHVHDGGIAITLSNATQKARMCTSVAGYGTKPQYLGSVEAMSICPYDRIGSIRTGEVLQLDTYYNQLRPTAGVMGIMIVYVYETTDLDGGRPPPAYYTAEPPKEPSTGNETGGHAH
jgi:hypothetical protein